MRTTGDSKRTRRSFSRTALALGTAVAAVLVLFPLAALADHNAADFFMFARAEFGSDRKSNELNCDGSNDGQASVAGSDNVVHGRIHSNADIVAASGSGNTFNDELTYGTHDEDCQEQSESGNTYVAGQPADLDAAPAGVTNGWPGDLDSYVAGGLTIDSIGDALPGEACDEGNLNVSSDYTINPVADNGKVICRGSGKVQLSASDATLAITILSHGPIEISGQNVTLVPAAHNVIAFTDHQLDVAIKLAGSNFNVPVSSIFFAPRGGIDTSGSNDSEMCIQLVGQGPIRLPGSRNVVGPGSSACTNQTPGFPDVKVTKTGNGTVSAGGTAQFTIEIENVGDADAIDVDIVGEDQLPEGGLNWSIASQGLDPGFTGGSDCEESSNELDCEIDVLAPGRKYRVVVTASVTGGTQCGNKPNTVTIEANNEPANVLGNNTSSDTITIPCPPGTLIVYKQVVNNNGGTATASAFTMTVTGPTSLQFAGSETGTSNSVAPGSYTVGETAPTGYTLTYPTSGLPAGVSSNNCNTQGEVTVNSGQTRRCVLRNDDQQAKLIVIKNVVNDDGGTATSANFTMTVDDEGSNPPSFPGAAAPGTTVNVDPGSYSVGETGPAGYQGSFSADCSGTIELGQTKTCTVTNDDTPATLIVKKVVINDNGGSAGPDAFSFQVNGGAATAFEADGQNDLSVGAGTYDVTEPAVSGYTTTYEGCSNVQLALGQTKTCTVTNDDQPATLVVRKVVVNDDGGSATADDFSFQLDDGAAQAWPNDGGDALVSETSLTVSAGTHDVTEPTVAGYATTYSNCADVTVAPGGTATCIVTNDDEPATLTVVKELVNDDGGGKAFGDFTFDVSGPTASSNTAFDGDGSITLEVAAGTYTVTEDQANADGYATTYENCTSVQIPVGGAATCTITNDDEPATLTVVKELVNDDGGGKAFGDFTFDVAGPTASQGTAFDGDGSVSLEVAAGTYTVTENEANQAGYLTTYDNCVDVVLPLGGAATCTITNDDEAGSLVVVKELVNDNGGTKTVEDFSFDVSGPTPSQNTPFDADGSVMLVVDGGTYTVTENEANEDGYATSYANCEDVVVPLGGEATCTITNDDAAPSLTLVKVVQNDNGGTSAAGDWSLTASGPTGFTGAGPQVSSDADFESGTYDLSESAGPSGYAASAWDCDGGQLDGDTVEVGVGDDVTCTITNDDVAPELTLVKEVVNDNGGMAQASAWTLTATGPSGFNGLGPTVTSGPSFAAGSYDLSESGPAGYDAGDWDCTSESNVDGDTVQVGLGDDITCTITNDDRPATLIVVKNVINDSGGTATAGDFQMTIGGVTAQGGSSFPGAAAPGVTKTLTTVGSYSVTETLIAGYTQTGASADCSGTIALGQTKTCTITNNDVPRGQGSIDVQKSAEPTSVKEPGGLVTFSVRITNTSADVNVTIANVVDDKFGDLDDSGGNGCFDVPINMVPGESATCQFQGQVTGAAGTTHVNVVTASGSDQNGNPVSDSDDARVDITERTIDLVIVKEATSPTPLNGTVTYTMTVTNKGPDTATNVQLADPAPSGISYLTVSATQGSCSLTAALITCNLGSLAAGQTVTVTVTARATAVGTHVNTATVTGGGGRETAPADNVDSAQTVVPAPFVPPTAKPTSKRAPTPQMCLTLTVTPKMITADGKPDRIAVRAAAGKKRMKGVRVVVRGSGVDKSSRTNRKGVATMRINPKRAGIVTITAIETNQRVCGPKRIGVVGVFLPPLTG